MITMNLKEFLVGMESKAQLDARCEASLQQWRRDYEADTRDWFFIEDVEGVSRWIHLNRLTETLKSKKDTSMKGKNGSPAAKRRALTVCE
jgi:hypothetical protein